MKFSIIYFNPNFLALLDAKSVKWLLDASGEVVVHEIRSLYFEDSEENAEMKMNDMR